MQAEERREEDAVNSGHLVPCSARKPLGANHAFNSSHCILPAVPKGSKFTFLNQLISSPLAEQWTHSLQMVSCLFCTFFATLFNLT
jgi:hypothetical protein